jgi:hypothetical protein
MKAYILLAIILAAFASGGCSQPGRCRAGLDTTPQRSSASSKRPRSRASARPTCGRRRKCGHEADKDKLRTEFLTITQTVEKIVEKPVYRDMCLDDCDGLRALSPCRNSGNRSPCKRACVSPAQTCCLQLTEAGERSCVGRWIPLGPTGSASPCMSELSKPGRNERRPQDPSCLPKDSR